MIYVVITGASRGIGAALANIYYKAGYSLILNCKNNIELLNQTWKEKSLNNSDDSKKVYCIQGSLTVEKIKSLLKKDDQIYMIINNAGEADYSLLQDLSLDRWKELLNSNLTSVFENTKAVLSNMLHYKQGIILNISSIWGILGAANEVCYSTTKGGVNAFTKALAKELDENGIEVFAIALGAVDTDMNKHLDSFEKENFEKTLTNGKMFSPSEIADKIYNIQRKHKYKNGEIVEMNNGLK